MKKYTVTCPAMRVRGHQTKLTRLTVYYRLTLPWKEIRPMIACAFRHTQREGLGTLGPEFIRRMALNEPQLFLSQSKHGSWYGHAQGATAYVFTGNLHTQPEIATYGKFKDMPRFWHLDWKEHLVGIVAHEAWHRWQPRWGKKAEHMCELVEWDAVDRWQREQGYSIKPLNVHTEPSDLKHDPAESCTDCRQPTRSWLEDQHTPLCEDCCIKRNAQLLIEAKLLCA